jgi:hypothetical protein
MVQSNAHSIVCEALSKLKRQLLFESCQRVRPKIGTKPHAPPWYLIWMFWVPVLTSFRAGNDW